MRLPIRREQIDGLGDTPDYAAPVPQALLTKQARRGIPGRAVLIITPSRIRRLAKQHPDRPSQSACQVDRRAVYADQQIELLKNLRRVLKGLQVIAQMLNIISIEQRAFFAGQTVNLQ